MNKVHISLCFIVYIYILSVYPSGTCYVDYGSGSDSNNGLSMSTPWKHCPGDQNATGNPALTTLTAGSTFFLRRV